MEKSVKEKRLKRFYPDLPEHDINLIIDSENATFDGILPEKAESEDGFRILSRMASVAYHREEYTAGLL